MHTKIEDTLICLKKLKTLWKGLVGVYPNSSSYNNSNNINSTEWAFEQVIHKEKFINYAKAWNDFGVDFVGGCCGINVEHIKELAKIIK
jgi:S-methylmethionine-dependent homocysteine/selenocysteine methylase